MSRQGAAAASKQAQKGQIQGQMQKQAAVSVQIPVQRIQLTTTSPVSQQTAATTSRTVVSDVFKNLGLKGHLDTGNPLLASPPEASIAASPIGSGIGDGSSGSSPSSPVNDPSADTSPLGMQQGSASGSADTRQTHQQRQQRQLRQAQQKSFSESLAKAKTTEQFNQLRRLHTGNDARIARIGQQQQKLLGASHTVQMVQASDPDQPGQLAPSTQQKQEKVQSQPQMQGQGQGQVQSQPQVQGQGQVQELGKWTFKGVVINHKWKFYAVFGCLFFGGLIGMGISAYFMAKQGQWANIFKKKKKEKQQQRQQNQQNQQPFGSARAGGEDAALAAMKSGNPALHPGPFSIAFVASWCSHCRAMKPALEHAVAQHNQKGLPPAYVVQVDNASFSPDKKAAVQAAMAAQRVDGLPTILRFDGASMHAADAYRGDRSAASLAAFFSKTRAI